MPHAAQNLRLTEDPKQAKYRLKTTDFAITRGPNPGRVPHPMPAVEP